MYSHLHPDAPKLPLVSLSPSGEIMEGISLTLTCISDSNPAADYTWFKENEKTPQGSGQNLTITNIGRQHSGLYYCEAHNSRGSHKSAIHLTVAASKSAKASVSFIYLCRWHVHFCSRFAFLFLFSIKILLCLIFLGYRNMTFKIMNIIKLAVAALLLLILLLAASLWTR